ncbi:MAG: hypothetical protein B7Y24_09555 [Sphingobacteriales bacterium 16-39-50]|nr:MAG: hypothetical protein B7Y24_09555 [Sphingobacteriales bacterium 16-39-50]
MQGSAFRDLAGKPHFIPALWIYNKYREAAALLLNSQLQGKGLPFRRKGGLILLFRTNFILLDTSEPILSIFLRSVET